MRERFQTEMSETTVAPLSGEGDQNQRDEFARWFYGQRAYPAERIPEGARANALAQAIRDNSPGGPGGPVSNVITPSWSALGPSTIPNGQTDTSVGPTAPVSGRLTAIAVHPTDPNTVYAAGAQGGVWKTTNAMAASPVWTPLTDAQASNAVGAIAIDPVNPNIVYVGTGEPNGSCDSYYGQGILRSPDGGFNWTLLTGGGGPPFNNAGPFVGKSVAKIIIDPMTAGSTSTTTLWAATTNGAFTSGTSAACLSPSGASRGVWKSTDSGATWTLQTAGSGTQSVKDAAIDPTNHDNLYAAVQASGVWKSTNAFTGAPAVYARQTVGLPDPTLASPTLGRINLAIGGSAASNTLYASYSSGGSNLWGMFMTTNGGTTWAHIDAGFNGTCNVSGTTVTRLTGPSFVTGSAWVGRRIHLNSNTSLTVSSVTNGNTLVLTSSGGSLAGVTWSVGTYPQYCNGQCFYDMTVAVDPTNANIVYVGGNPQRFGSDLSGVAGAHTNWRSDDGGATWTSISQGDASAGGVHTDDHVYAFDMTSGSSPRPVYDGNDGGIWRSGNKGMSWTTMNTNIAITQFSGVATHPLNMNIVLGGTQDNGTNLLNSALQPPPKWFHTDFGDGGQALIDQGTPARMFHTYFNASGFFMGPAKSTTGGNNGPGNWPFVGSYAGAGGLYYNGMNPNDPVSFYAPLAEHPGYTPNVIYFGSNKLYRSADPNSPCCATVSTTGCGFPGPIVCNLPASWTVVSPALTKGGSAYLSWIGVLPNLVAAKEVVYTGASDGRIEVTSNLDAGATATWTVIDKAPLPNRAVTQILVPGSDATGNTAYATFSGFNGNTPGVNGHVFKTTTGLGAATWTDISGDLPDIPVNAIATDPTTTPATLYVGTDIGVFQSVNSGTNWTLLSNGFPTVTVFGLERNSTTGQIVAATHGRGMFQLSTVTPLNFFTLTPCRVADTRGVAGPYGGPSLAAGADRTFVVINQCGVPPTAKAISANFTVTGPTNGPGFLSFFPGGTPLPLVSTIDYSAGQTRANNAILPLGLFGDVTVHCGQGGGTADLVFDVNGYFQ